VKSKSLKLDGHALTAQFVDGATLSPGTTHTLTGTVTFRRNSSTATSKAVLKFVTCAAG
jgi:hypothetical protein